MLQFEYEKDAIVNCKVGKSIIMARIEDVKHNIDSGKTLVVVSDGQDLYNLNPEDIIGKAKFSSADDELKKHDPVNHPAHYTDGKIEVIDFINDKKMNFNRGNVIKYVSRAGKKASKALDDKKKEIQDLEKAKFYLEDEIKRLKQQLEDND